ncbi:MAG: hypothetical protein HKO93_02835 [Flavobacteriales bacterium]|nr:hypothetical protein [Flavobacteriales bacterium]
MENIFRSIGKFWFPGACILAGIALLIFAGGPNPQPQEVYLGSFAILLIGIISLLFLLDLIKKPIRIALTAIFALVAVYFVMANTSSISDEIKLQKKIKLNKAMTIQALKDVRSAQQAYREVYGIYTQDLEELAKFVQDGSVPKVKKIGSIPDSVGTEERALEMGLIQKMPEGMTDDEVKAAGLIVRDTIQIPVMEDKFTNDIAMKSRKFDFDPNKIIYAPTSGKPWEVRSGVTNIGGVDQPVLLVVDPEPFMATKSEALRIGSMEDAHLNGNWKED